MRVVHADGSQDIYGLGIAGYVHIDEFPGAWFLLTRRIDPHGNTTRLYYEGAVGLGFQYRVKYVVDYDGRTNTLQYNANGLVSSVTSPYGKTATFAYDQNADLTNLTDVVSLSTTLKYDTNGYPTDLITPYGTNHFEYTLNTTNTGGNFGGHDLINRAVRITEPTGGTHLYVYRYDSPLMPTYPTAQRFTLKERPQDFDGVSFRANLSNPLPKGERAVFRPGENYFGIDTSTLPPDSSIIPDAKDPFHFGVKGATPEELQKAVVPESKGLVG